MTLLESLYAAALTLNPGVCVIQPATESYKETWLSVCRTNVVGTSLAVFVRDGKVSYILTAYHHNLGSTELNDDVLKNFATEARWVRKAVRTLRMAEKLYRVREAVRAELESLPMAA